MPDVPKISIDPPEKDSTGKQSEASIVSVDEFNELKKRVAKLEEDSSKYVKGLV